MAIVIIKEGKKPEDIVYRKQCYKCNTIFTYLRCDVTSDQRDGNYIECPLCKQGLAHDSKNRQTIG